MFRTVSRNGSRCKKLNPAGFVPHSVDGLLFEEIPKDWGASPGNDAHHKEVSLSENDVD